MTNPPPPDEFHSTGLPSGERKITTSDMLEMIARSTSRCCMICCSLTRRRREIVVVRYTDVYIVVAKANSATPTNDHSLKYCPEKPNASPW